MCVCVCECVATGVNPWQRANNSLSSHSRSVWTVDTPPFCFIHTKPRCTHAAVPTTLSCTCYTCHQSLTFFALTHPCLPTQSWKHCHLHTFHRKTQNKGDTGAAGVAMVRGLEDVLQVYCTVNMCLSLCTCVYVWI